MVASPDLTSSSAIWRSFSANSGSGSPGSGQYPIFPSQPHSVTAKYFDAWTRFNAASACLDISRIFKTSISSTFGGESIFEPVLELESNSTLYEQYMAQWQFLVREAFERLGEDVGRLEGLGKAHRQVHDRATREIWQCEHAQLLQRVDYLTHENTKTAKLIGHSIPNAHYTTMILEWFSRFLPTASELEKEDTLPDTGSEPTNTTLDRLLPYTCPDAAVDSSARDPPPRCHPGTRQRILDTLNDWLINHLWKIFWLSGPAGTGKSAIAQTFAEICLEQGRLGAAYFFFRSSGRNDPRTVIPSLAYQLAVNVPDYGNLLGHAIALDPSIFQKTPRVQLRKLIVEPFTRLQAQGHRSTQIPLLIVLDGLDECQGIQAQCDIVEMIGEVVRLKKDFPILWLIMSRPEPHLQYIFSRADFSIECKKETLLIDADTRDDVDRYLRDSFIDIRRRFPLVTDVAWPSQAQSQTVEDIASGLFALAATIIRYISDIAYGDPMGRLGDFLAFMTNTNYATTTNPLQTLDLLYSQILSEIPENVYLRTKQILSLYQISNLEVLCAGNVLCMANHEFYNALSKLHSLFDVPSPGEAQMTCLIMYHTSFGDYLLTPFRSGRFHISREYIVVDCFKALFFWYKIILQDPHFVSDVSQAHLG
ncbi:hypothetical protein AGABI2DRAFT_176915 [Agaricus bisporus var. bisporus H97]|uniref:hypothetical protein n=1 Tax=Agaricus bisporus var. bisporus (strain H97 / ATCC MYA-4626 / FGSC 10389) TaxID=936046 RepID=UPI00029F5D28|nr:hypothetical protein AGABI2DRAFT_176915 [Agaricus bisporus var. bisporus H97]EKV50614.1 hypothetical protein AGABI2DRAFT_176915 [Agaricus bisporus var. bisporus H97]